MCRCILSSSGPWATRSSLPVMVSTSSWLPSLLFSSCQRPGTKVSQKSRNLLKQRKQMNEILLKSKHSMYNKINNDIYKSSAIFTILFFFFFLFFFFSVATFSHRSSVRIKNTYLAKLIGAPKNLRADTFSDPVGRFGAPYRPFWILQAVRHCRR